MINQERKISKMAGLLNKIEELRNQLNECCIIEEQDVYERRLNLSQRLDKLIVEYMKNKS